MERLFDLTSRMKSIMDNKNICINIYTNASGFLWAMCMVDSGTDLGWCDFNGNCELSGTFKSYEDALEDAILLIEKCDLDRFKSDVKESAFHWGNYSHHLNSNYRGVIE